jgi:hypothetical protein
MALLRPKNAINGANKRSRAFPVEIAPAICQMKPDRTVAVSG